MVTTLTIQVHVTSPVMRLSDTPVAISYKCLIVTKSVSPAILEIIGLKDIGGHDLGISGSGTSSFTWPIDPPYAISYWCPIGYESLSSTVFKIFGPQIPSAQTDRHMWFYRLFCPMQCIALDRQ